jgi:hypothetical protein
MFNVLVPLVLNFLILLLSWLLVEYIFDCIQKKQKKDLRLMTYFDNFPFQKNPIYEQVLLFAGSLLPDEKIIVSKRDFHKILSCKDKNGYSIVDYSQKESYISYIRLEKETINNFFRVELGETKTNRNFELKE